MKKRSVFFSLTFFSLTVLILLITFIPISFAQTAEMNILAVAKSQNTTGSAAKLTLTITEGTGETFISVTPAANLDTQLSTRLAKNVACDFLEVDCSNKNFFYTISANSNIIGGPSASAAVTVLTAALLDNQKINKEITITGTITSGGLIGGVGGIKEKIDAAELSGMKKVLVPLGKSRDRIDAADDYNNEDYNNNEDNNINRNIGSSNNFNNSNITKITKTLREYGLEKGIEVVEVATLADALTEISGKDYRKELKEIKISPMYVKKMDNISNDLCMRADGFLSELRSNNQSNYSEINNPEKNNKSNNLINAVDFTQKAKEAYDSGKYYSSASYCYSALIVYDFLLLNTSQRNMSWLGEKYDKLKNTTDLIEIELDSTNINSINNLQTYIIVKERLREAKAYLNEIEKIVIFVNVTVANRTAMQTARNGSEIVNEDALRLLSSATERIYSIKTWSTFFSDKKDNLKINDKLIERSCIQLTAEAESNLQYLQILSPFPYDGIIEDINDAKSARDKGDMIQCMFLSTNAKARVDSVLSVIGSPDEIVPELVDAKLKLAQESIAKHQDDGSFPILGYSYYEYAQSLKESDPVSALIYSHYALEHSNLDVYLKETELKDTVTIEKDVPEKLSITVAFILGFLTCYFVLSIRRKRSVE